MTTHEILLAAQAAKLPLALADTDTKNAALEAMAVALVENSDAILAANKQDLAAARGHISDVMLDRLALTLPGWPPWPRACVRLPPCRTRWAPCYAKLCGRTGC